MATTVADIITPAINSSLANDAAESDLTGNVAELIAVISRRVRQLYTLAAMSRDFGGMGKGYYFASSETIVVAGSPVALATTAAFRHSIIDANGHPVAVVSQADLDEDRAEIPPAVVIEQGKLRSAGRTGDPAVGASLTVRYTPLPGVLTAETHYIGATTVTDATTTAWPAHVGDPYLIAWLARYLALKAGDRDPQEMQQLDADLGEAATLLGEVIGVDTARLAGDTEDEAAA